jgi:hypothetical protein
MLILYDVSVLSFSHTPSHVQSHATGKLVPYGVTVKQTDVLVVPIIARGYRIQTTMSQTLTTVTGAVRYAVHSHAG